MALELVTIPALTDNYAYLLHDPASGATAVIDVPEAAPIAAALDDRGWTLTEIWLTHHHADHVQGLDELLAGRSARVTGAAADAHRLPPLDREVSDGDRFEFGSETVEVMDVSGHTIGHLAFHLPEARIAFTADSLMAMGCGRLFEGTAAQMWHSLSRLAALPGDTRICSGHEYAAANARFAQSVDPENAALAVRTRDIEATRNAGRPTVPSRLSEELATNPFLRARDPEMKRRLGLENATDEAVFAEIRRRKDAF